MIRIRDRLRSKTLLETLSLGEEAIRIGTDDVTPTQSDAAQPESKEQDPTEV